MKTIYFLEKHPVKIGDVVEYKRFRATVTEKLIEFNPELFTVKDTMQELLDEAKRRYPSGTRYISFNEHKISNKEDLPLVVSEIGIPHINHHEFDNTTICIDSGKYNGVIYSNGKWAEILPLKFTTEDGVGIYGDMKTYAICRDELILDLPSVYGGNSSTLIYFYHKENALAYIKKHKEKTLEDYEKMLLPKEDYTLVLIKVHFNIWSWMKVNEPKLYYTKILQLIADDLNDDWVADFSNNDEKWCITVDGGTALAYAINRQGVVYFKNLELAEKARDILGDKLEYLYN